MAIISKHQSKFGICATQASVDQKGTIDKFGKDITGCDVVENEQIESYVSTSTGLKTPPSHNVSFGCKPAGNIQFNLMPNGMATQDFLAHFFGANTVTGDAANGYLHTFEINNDSLEDYSNGFTLLSYYGRNAGKLFYGCFLNSLNFNFPANANCTGDAGVVGYDYEYISTPPTTTFEEGNSPFVSSGFVAKIGDAEDLSSATNNIKVLSGQVAFNKNIDTDIMSGGRIAHFVDSAIDTTINLEVIYKDNFEYDNFIKNLTQKSLELSLTHASHIAGGTNKSSIKMLFPKVNFQGDSVALEPFGDGMYKQNLTIKPSLATGGSDLYSVKIEVLDATEGVFLTKPA